MVTNKELHRQWALAGAAVRLREIQAEIAEIHRAFPELRKGGRVPSVDASTGDVKKRKFSAKGKEAISEGMREVLGAPKALAAKAAAK